MAPPKLFIGSSQKNLRVAQLLASSLSDCAVVDVWNEGVFGLGYGFLETLVKRLEDYDFAAFVLASDDMTTSKDESKPAPRDNVLFESGLFMGVLGRDRVFLVYDASVDLKIPSDLAGVTLAKYDSTRISGVEGKGAVRDAVLQISDRIKASRFPYLVGEWRSEYPMTFEEGYPMVTEEMSVRTSGDTLSLVTKTSSHDDFYSAWGRIVLDRQIIGKWKSQEGKNNMEGVFVLTISPHTNFMYGYFTSPDEQGGLVYATWILAKMTDADETEVNERMRKARAMLKKITILGPQIPSVPNS
ncbi:MAG TPA: hypothetical protein DC054_16145 [Blastocatellia bacterium]|nr:hypothetical protein [Blastocatellia bacterium]